MKHISGNNPFKTPHALEAYFKAATGCSSAASSPPSTLQDFMNYATEHRHHVTAESFSVLERGAELFPNDAVLLCMTGSHCAVLHIHQPASGLDERAMGYLKRSLALAPHDNNTLRALVNFLGHSKRFAEARPFIEKLEALYPSLSRGHKRLVRDTIETFNLRRDLAIGPLETEQHYIFFGKEARREYTEADLQVLDRGLEIYPRSIGIMMKAANMSLKLHDRFPDQGYDIRALTYIDAALATRDSQLEVLNNGFRITAALGHYDRAEYYATRLYEATEGALTHDELRTIGMLYEITGRPKLALACYEEAGLLAPDKAFRLEQRRDALRMKVKGDAHKPGDPALFHGRMRRNIENPPGSASNTFHLPTILPREKPPQFYDPDTGGPGDLFLEPL